MPLSYSSGQAISMGAIRDYHGGSGSVSMRDLAIGGSLIYKATSVAGSTEQGWNNFTTQAQLDAGTHSLSLNDLEIRGGGFLFGFKQSGFSSVGFEFYSKTLSSFLSLKEEEGECFVDCFSGFLPFSYILRHKSEHIPL